jgi:3',5'-cyclic AMP phosphodiesterase CpdA
MLTILHASDLHFGKHFDSDAAEALRSQVEESTPELLVLSGDFTQRAKVREYEAARDFLSGFRHLPVVVTPGNHDVPLYRVWERALAPLRNYRAFISAELDTVTRIPGVTVVGLDSTDPHGSIVNGRLRARQLRFAREAFREAPEGDLRILVIHHNLVPAPDYRPEPVLPGQRACLEAFARMGVELILSGHLHRAFVADSRSAHPGVAGERAMALVYSGTTTSKRGRTKEEGKNSLNLIRVTDVELAVTQLSRERGGGAFEPVATHSFFRREGAAILAGREETA